MNTIIGLVGIGFGFYVAYKYHKKDESEKSKKETALVVVGVIFFVFGGIGLMNSDSSKKNVPTNNKTVETSVSKKVETPVVEDEDTKVANKVKEYVKKYYNDTTIDSITLNPDLGTEKNDDYVLLVRFTWNVKNSAKTSKEMLDMYSSDMAARIYNDLPEIQELAVFWTVPYLNNGNAKISFERVSNGMRYTDTIFDKNFK